MKKTAKDNVNVANPVPVTAQNIDGSMPINDLTSKVIYLLGQSERHTEQLNTLNDTTRDLHNDITDLDHRLNGRIDRVLDKVDTNFKWTVGTLIMPIITMVMTIIVNLLITKK